MTPKPLFHRQLVTHAGVNGIIDRRAAVDVILRLGRQVTAFQQLVGHQQVEGVGAGAGTIADHQDAVAGLSHIQRGGQANEARTGVRVTDDRREQAGLDLLGRKPSMPATRCGNLGLGWWKMANL